MKKKGIYFSDEELKLRGCKTCVHRSFNVCPHGFKLNPLEEQTYSYVDDEGKVVEGICPEYLTFLLNFAGDSNDKKVMLENFNAYTIDLEVGFDRTEMHELKAQLDRARKEGWPENKLASLEMRYQTIKLWWNRIADSLAKTLKASLDREAKVEDADAYAKLTIQQLNTFLKGNLIENKGDKHERND